jgi:hypothetical protein
MRATTITTAIATTATVERGEDHAAFLSGTGTLRSVGRISHELA